MITHYVANYEKCRKYVFLGGYAQIFTYYIGRVIEIFIQCYMGEGSSQFISILQWGGGGGVSRDPEFELRNIWTTPYYYFSGQDQVYMN